VTPGTKQNEKRHPVVAIVVVNWNRRELLAQCLESLVAQTWTDREIFVVDNGSQDGSEAFVAEKYPEVHLIRAGGNIGFARANNLAIRRTRSKYVALINNDAAAEPNWLQQLVAALEADRWLGMAASKMVYHDNPEVIDRAGDGYSLIGAGVLRGRGGRADAYNQPREIFGACAGAALYRRDMLEDIGLFDEAFFLIYEDVDLSFRAQLAGYRCRYVPGAKVRHKASHTIGRDSRTSVFYGHRNLEWVYFRNMPGLLLALTFFPHLFYVILAGAYFLLIGKGGNYLSSKLEALKGMPSVIVKRKVTQGKRRVPLSYLLRLFTLENPAARLKARHVG
jgi:GT2 family glycosyltransferase